MTDITFRMRRGNRLKSSMRMAGTVARSLAEQLEPRQLLSGSWLANPVQGPNSTIENLLAGMDLLPDGSIMFRVSGTLPTHA